MSALEPCLVDIKTTPETSGIVDKRLMKALRNRFQLDWYGVHGVRHWGRVRRNGLTLARATGANITVVELFAVLHDVCRLNDHADPDHGFRGASLAAELNGSYFQLSDDELETLCRACSGHSNGYIASDVTTMTCWDADRLDLGRIGIAPAPERLCTPQAKSTTVIAWAYQRSIKI